MVSVKETFKKKRFDEHRDVKKPTTVSLRMMASNHEFLINDVKVLANGNSDTVLSTNESLYIKY